MYDNIWRFYDLPNGKRIEEYEIKSLSNLEDILYLMDREYSYFKILKPEFRDNPLVLKRALIKFIEFYDFFSGYSGTNLTNPISWAGENALTKENLDLALTVKDSNISKNAIVLKNLYFCEGLYSRGRIISFDLLPAEMRNNPEILNKALSSFNPNDNAINPICYALDGALTKENIRLALEKGCIVFIDNSPLFKNELFHKINIEKGTIKIEYKYLPYSIKNNVDLMLIYISRYPDVFLELTADQRSNPAFLHNALLKYDSTFIGIVNPICYALDGALTEENIRLALEKGNIIFIDNSPLFKSALFHRINIEKGTVRIEYKNLPDSVKNNDNLMLIYISRYPDNFENLNETQKGNPNILNAALVNFNSNTGLINPITYAKESALTKENIELALEKGKIQLLRGGALANNKYFILECLKRDLYTDYYSNISEALKNDPEINQILINKIPSIIQSKPIDRANGWSPQGNNRIYKYYQAVIALLPNGELKEEEVRGRSNRTFNHYQGVSNVVRDLERKYPNNETIKQLQTELRNRNVIDNPFLKAIKCSEFGIIILLIEGENAQIYFPKNISKDQFNVLQSLTNDLKDLNFRFLYEDEEYYEYIEPETHNSRDLKINDVIKFIIEKNIYIPTEIIDIHENSVNDAPPSL